MLKPIFRILALFALAMTLITAVLDIARSIADSQLIITPLGQDWFNFSSSTLNLAQATIQRYIHPVIWDPVIQKILLAPSWLVFGVIWFCLMWIGRQSNNRWRDKYSA